ncbi:hypothetical protein BST25_19760 [Mycobacterium heidelbergense]|uniref:Uncharacterized protein n=1 Tax=Mycobacterium heidelbergense TaxID=53376 RepID=A0A1X0DDI6_MYCHE|nr:AAA family ATPase [Mycobacterium heidelbergense]ORA70252.1 hypothetical protein BST25_19760 [Mycobacterium heidelbergense]BBZ50523.1 hypothetical protein MHEI_22400 [Mycobacterium heidelbergense]
MSVGWREWDDEDTTDTDEVLGATGIWLIPRTRPVLVEPRRRIVTTNTGREAHAGTALAAEHREVLEWAQARIDELIGLAEAKEHFTMWRTALQNNHHHHDVEHGGVVTSCRENHMVLLGAAGTAKKTFARVIAEVLFGLGVITRPEVTEITAHDIVAGDPSHSAARMKTVCDDARGGVLFLDEAHQLAPDTESRPFGGDVIAALQTHVAHYPGELVVILAGHPTPMQNFLTTHAGLAGRFPHTVAFTSPTPDDIVALGHRLAGKENLIVEDTAWELLRTEAARLRSIPYGHGTLLDVAGNAHYAHDVIHTCQRARLRRLHKLAPHRRDLEHLLHTNPGVLHVNTTDMQRALTATHPAVTA